MNVRSVNPTIDFSKNPPKAGDKYVCYEEYVLVLTFLKVKKRFFRKNTYLFSVELERADKPGSFVKLIGEFDKDGCCDQMKDYYDNYHLYHVMIKRKC